MCKRERDRERENPHVRNQKSFHSWSYSANGLLNSNSTVEEILRGIKKILKFN